MKKKLLGVSLFFVAITNSFSQSTIWKPYDINVGKNFGSRYLSAVSGNIAWSIVYDGSTASTRATNQYVRTSNGGTFTKGTFLSDTNTYNPSNIIALDSLNAYVAVYEKAADGRSGKIIKTIDGGAHWTNASDTVTMFAGANNFPDFVCFWDHNNGLALGDPNGNTGSGATDEFEIWRTHNGGTNWTRVADANIPNPMTSEYGITNSYATYGKRMWFGTGVGRVYNSIDSGKTWNVNTGTIGLAGGVQGLTFRDSLNGFAWGYASTSATSNILKKTADGGTTWTAVTLDPVNTGLYYFSSIPGAKSYMSVGLNSGSTGYVTSITKDDGATWNLLEMGTALSYNKVTLQMLDSTTGWAGNFADTTSPLGKGGMNKYIRYPTTTGIAKISNTSKISIYPNPSNGMITISVPEVKEGTVMYVTDMIGKEVFKASINDVNTNVNLSGLQKGMYMMTIVNGQNAQVEKLIIQQ